MKNQGITILQIVIAVVIMLIIASIAIFSGQGVTQEANISSIYSEIKDIRSAIKEIYVTGDYRITGNSIILYDEIELEKKSKTDFQNELKDEEDKGYYYLDFTSSKELSNVLDFEQRPKHDYILDWENQNIYVVDGVELPSGDSALVNVLVYDSNEIIRYYDNVFVK